MTNTAEAQSSDARSEKIHSRRFLKRGILAAIAILVLAGQWIYYQQLDLRPVYLALPLNAGGMAETTFVPTHTDFYEVEVELREPATPKVFNQYVKTTGPGAFDAGWVVSSAGESAQGELASYLYLSMVGPNRRQVLRAVGHETYTDISKARMARGVGRFRANAGSRVDVRVEVHSDISADCSAGEPHLVVRLNRRLRGIYLQRAMAIGAVAIGLALLSLLLGRRPRDDNS